VFEAGPHAGGHTNTVDIEWDGDRQSIDTGFIVFNDDYYPNFRLLVGRLGVETQLTTMSLSVRCDRTGLEYAGADVDSLFAQRRNLLNAGFWRMLRDIRRFHREGVRALDALNDTTTVAEYVAEQGYSSEFLRFFLTPMGSALWSSPQGDFLGFPVRFIIEFFRNHGMMQITNRPPWRVIRGGSARYVEPLVRPFQDRIRLNAPVRSIRRGAESVEVVTERDGGEAFDEAILACHSDQALAMLGGAASAVEREVLSHFPYQRNDTVLHTDTSVLPRNRRAWSCWNYHLVEDRGRAAAVTYNMNMLQSLRSAHTYCVSLNESGIDPAKVIRRMVYHHPVFRPGRAAMQARHRELIRHHRTSYCGAYWGFGFHEDGVRSALAVCKAFGKELA
jgi:predicted NAD/FAD-binding protein